MSQKEAQARIKINKLLEAAGWRFFDEVTGKANIALEPNAKLQQAQVDAMGHDFDTMQNGFIDFLLLDKQGFPHCSSIREHSRRLFGVMPDHWVHPEIHQRTHGCQFVI